LSYHGHGHDPRSSRRASLQTRRRARCTRRRFGPRGPTAVSSQRRPGTRDKRRRRSSPGCLPRVPLQGTPSSPQGTKPASGAKGWAGMARALAQGHLHLPWHGASPLGVWKTSGVEAELWNTAQERGSSGRGS
jgi:hypothetical protein